MEGIIVSGLTHRAVGRGYLSSDHISTATGLDPAFTISKNGGAFANPAAGASVMTEIEATGWYYFALATGDTDTVGPLICRGTHATMDNIEVVLQVVSAIRGLTGTAVPAVAGGAAGGLVLGSAANNLAVDAAGKVAVPDTQKVDIETIKTRAVACGAGVTVNPSVGAATIQPTVTEFELRTLPAADYVVVTDTIARVTLTDTCTTNTDLVTAAAIKSAMEAAGSMLYRTYYITNNKMIITEATGATALRNLVDGADVATSTITDGVLLTTRDGWTWI